MARISSYPKHTPVKPEDYWIGTKASNLMTRNFTAKAVSEYINESGGISMATSVLFRFKVVNGVSGDITGVTDSTPFSSITSLEVSDLDISRQNVVGFLQYLVGTDIIICEQNNISTFGHYTIDSYTQVASTGFYTMSLTFIGGSGVLVDEKLYNLGSFVLSSGGTGGVNTTYDLDLTQSGSNADIRLTGSDSTVDTVVLEAGSNISLTSSGNNVRIDASGSGDKNYVHDQPVASATWTVQHDLNKFPSCTVVLSTGQKGYGDITFIDENNLTIEFAGAESGKSYIN